VYWSRWNLWASRSAGRRGYAHGLVGEALQDSWRSSFGDLLRGQGSTSGKRAPRVGHQGRPGRCAPCPRCATSVAFGRPSVRSDGSVPASRRRHSTSARSTWPSSAGCARVRRARDVRRLLLSVLLRGPPEAGVRLGHRPRDLTGGRADGRDRAVHDATRELATPNRARNVILVIDPTACVGTRLSPSRGGCALCASEVCHMHRDKAAVATFVPPARRSGDR
jgi:hypothetical protein